MNIYVDGSCSKNPGPGGYGVVIFESWRPNNVIYTYHEKAQNTTNNREELKAILHATEWLLNNNEKGGFSVIYSDSSYCVNVLNQWMFKWGRSNWKNSRGNQIENIDLIIPLYHYYTKKISNCQVEKIKGHHNEVGNELADALATYNKPKFIQFAQTIENKDEIIKNF